MGTAAVTTGGKPPSIEDQLADLQTKVATMQDLEKRLTRTESDLAELTTQVKQLQVSAALATAPKTAGTPSTAALLRRLDKHGIRVQPEDEEEAQGSGTERYGSAGQQTWAESHDSTGAPV